jgi:RNA polymerase sigma-70 factor, ECF subfamily
VATLDDTWQAAVRAAGGGEDAIAHVAACRERGALIEHVGDLCLAFAAGCGDPDAVRRFEAYVATDIDAAARKLDTNADELRQATRVRLLVGTPPRIHGYAGRGPLRGWVGVAALRIALNHKRGPAMAAEDVLAELVATEPDPELRHMKTLYRAEFREALAGALRDLPKRDRALLRLYYVDGMRLAQLARLYGVHESTASRWLAAATDAVAAATRDRLVAKLAVSAATADSLAKMVASGLDLSISKLLGTI